jgi:cytosine/adenosine deaminase-related metal-dependent hydrolase
MLDAMAHARRLWPTLAPDVVLAMATVHAAIGIGRPGLGRLRTGSRADLCAFALPRTMAARDALEAATAGALPVLGVWLCGRRVQ